MVLHRTDFKRTGEILSLLYSVALLNNVTDRMMPDNNFMRLCTQEW